MSRGRYSSYKINKRMPGSVFQHYFIMMNDSDNDEKVTWNENIHTIDAYIFIIFRYFNFKIKTIKESISHQIRLQ